MKARLQRLIAYGTGALALIVVAAAAGSAITYAVMHGAETLTQLGNSVLQGICMAVGGHDDQGQGPGGVSNQALESCFHRVDLRVPRRAVRLP